LVVGGNEEEPEEEMRALVVGGKLRNMRKEFGFYKRRGNKEYLVMEEAEEEPEQPLCPFNYPSGPIQRSKLSINALLAELHNIGDRKKPGSGAPFLRLRHAGDDRCIELGSYCPMMFRDRENMK
jgi:hypothetical protein